MYCSSDSGMKETWVFMRFYVLNLAAHERNKDRETGDRVAIGKHACIALKRKRAWRSDCMGSDHQLITGMSLGKSCDCATPGLCLGAL